MQTALIISLVGVAAVFYLTAIIEWIRYRRAGADCFTIFYIIYALQCLVPTLFIFAALLMGAGGAGLGNVFFDRVYSAITGSEVIYVSFSAGCFLLTSYLSYAGVCHNGAGKKGAHSPAFRLEVRPELHAGLTIIGVLSGLFLVYSFSPSLAEGYQALIRYRNLDEGIERTFVNANLFSLTQTFLFIAMLGPFISKSGNRISAYWPFWVLAIAVLALFCVSRRSLVIPGLLCIFTLLLAKRKVRIRYVAALFVFGLSAIFIGKNVLSYLSSGSAQIVRPERTLVDDVLYVSSDIGITVTESLGTVALIDMPLRFGIDHAYSVLRRFPSGMLGLEPSLPERIVRVSTGVLAGTAEQDIPPGLFGQMWLDFRAAGPCIYGLFWGVGLGLLERLRRSFVIDLEASAVFALVLFIYCLPVNSGSLDFTFSVDIILFSFMLACLLRVRRVEGRNGSTSSPHVP